MYFELRDFVAAVFDGFPDSDLENLKLASYFTLFEEDIVEWVCQSRINGEKWVEEVSTVTRNDFLCMGVPASAARYRD